jgi:16S rRNA (guanine527-N7)-methyltransferase
MAFESYKDLSTSQIRQHLAPFGIAPTDEQTARILDYVRILLAWNRAVNLTAITDPLEIVERHFGESMYASTLLPVENCRLADVGSGAGFPGLAMKIVSPSINVVLIESNKKKCAFLAEAVRVLGFEEVEIIPERFERIRPAGVEANIVTSRAVGGLKDIIRWSESALTARGHLNLWVGAEDSIRIARTINWTWQPPARIPESRGRFILIGRPLAENT